MNRAERNAARIALGRDAVMTEAMAVELLPFSDAACRGWLRAKGLVREIPTLGRYVLWGEVLETLKRPEADQAHKRPRPVPPPDLPRKDLRRARSKVNGSSEESSR